MKQSELPADLPASLDAVHERVSAAFRARNIAEYLQCLSPDLTYRDAAGRIITRDGVGKSVARQLRRLVMFHSDFDRFTLRVEENDAIETGIQSAMIALRWFWFLAIRWTVRRRGTYTWRRTSDSWQLYRVELDEEHVQRDGIHSARKLRRAANDEGENPA